MKKITGLKCKLRNIYTTFVRPVLEQSAPVWHSRLTAENAKDLERIQKAAVRLIMGRRHLNYKTSLSKLNLQELPERRETLCVNFAKRTTQNKKMRHMFPHRKELRSAKRRHTELYHVKNAKTERLKNSAIPYMQNLLNKENNQQRLDESY